MGNSASAAAGEGQIKKEEKRKKDISGNGFKTMGREEKRIGKYYCSSY